MLEDLKEKLKEFNVVKINSRKIKLTDGEIFFGLTVSDNGMARFEILDLENMLFDLFGDSLGEGMKCNYLNLSNADHNELYKNYIDSWYEKGLIPLGEVLE